MTAKIMFLMMFFSYGGNWLPGPEFATKEKCEAAAANIKQQIDPEIRLGELRLPKCIRIEK